MAYYTTSHQSTAGNVTIGNITLTGSGYSPASMIVTGGYSGTGYTLNTSATNGTWATASGTSTPSIQVKGNAEFEGKVMINGADIAETLRTIQDRLSILIPDPARLEKYEALKQAYEHYKTLEALCVEEDKSDSKQ